MSTKTNTGGARLRHPPRKQVFSGGLLCREASLCASGHSQSETQASANKWANRSKRSSNKPLYCANATNTSQTL